MVLGGAVYCFVVNVIVVIDVVDGIDVIDVVPLPCHPNPTVSCPVLLVPTGALLHP